MLGDQGFACSSINCRVVVLRIPGLPGYRAIERAAVGLQEVPAYIRACCMRACSILQGIVHAVSDPQHYNHRCSCYQSQATLAIMIGEPSVPDVHLESLADFPGWQC